MELRWEDDFKIRVGIHKNEVTVSANRDGLLSLANHLLALAEEASGSHIHLDQYNSLEDGSVELIVERID